MCPPDDRNDMTGLTRRQEIEQAEALAALGLMPLDHDLPPADGPPPSIDVWPDNWHPARLFHAMQTQRILAPNGLTIGLRYEALNAVEPRLGIPAEESGEVFRALEVMVDAMLVLQAQRMALH